MKNNKVNLGKKIGLYRSISNSSIMYQNDEFYFSLERLIEKCKNGAYSCLTSEYRKFTTTEERKAVIKHNEMWCVTNVGLLSRRGKNKSNFLWNTLSATDSSTGYVFGDIDKLEGYDLDQIKKVLMEDENIFFVKKSLSGQGFHFLFQIDGGVEYYKPALQLKYEQLSKKLGNKIDHNSFDTAVMDWTRIMVLNDDPSLYIDKNKEILNVINSNIIEDLECEKIKAKSIINIDKSKIKDISKIDKVLVTRFTNFIKKFKWKTGSRNKCIRGMYWFVLENLKYDLEDISVLFHNFVAGDYTDENTYDSINEDISIIYSDLKEKENQDFFLKKEEKKSVTEFYNKEENNSDLFLIYNKKGDTIYFNNYINDNKEKMYEYLTKKLSSEKILLIDSPTGSGKTTVMFEYLKEKNIKTDFIFPSRLLTQQQKAKKIVGKDKDIYIDELIVCATWENLLKMGDRKSKLLVIDEAHLMVTSNKFKSNAIDIITKCVDRYDNIILLTGTPEPLDTFFDSGKIIFKKHKPSIVTYDIISFPKRKLEYVANQIMILNRNNCLNIYYKNNLEELEQLTELFENNTDKKIGILNANEKDGELYNNIKDKQKIDTDVDWLLTTCVIREGVNITDDFGNVNIVFGTGVDITDIKQFTARFRNAKNIHINILHKDNNHCSYVNKERLSNTIKSWKEEYKKYETIEKNYLFNEFAIFFSTMRNFIYNDIETNDLLVNKIQVLSYLWLYEKMNQTNHIPSLERSMSDFERKTDIKYDSISILTEEVENVVQSYNNNKKSKILDYIEKIKNNGIIENDTKYKEDINDLYFSLLEVITKKQITDLKLDLTKKSKTRKFIDDAKFCKNYETIKLGFNTKNNVVDFMERKYVKFCDDIITKDYMNKQQILDLLYEHTLLDIINFTTTNPKGLIAKVKTKREIIDGEEVIVKIYKYTLKTFVDLGIINLVKQIDIEKIIGE